MPRIPSDHSPDSSLALLREGYNFIPRRCRRYRSDIVQTRLLMQKTICISGEQAAGMFYDKNLFTRENAAPDMLQKTLFGVGGVQGLDGTAHRVRKQMFMLLMTPERIDELVHVFTDRWLTYLDQWERTTGSILLMREVQEILCRAVCAWTGVPLADDEVRQRTEDLLAMIEGAGSVGPRHLRARRARKRAEAWIGGLIDQVRSGKLAVDEERALHVVAHHRDADGKPLDRHTAAVELINVLRPVIANDRFVAFSALELHRHPEYRRKLQQDDDLVGPFVQEIRRLYAFFPFVAARVREDFDWKGYRFPKGTRVLLDLYGTNRDPRVWDDPDSFRPERFHHWNHSAYNFITQGGGNHFRNHRCPGEWITIALMKVAARLLTRSMNYDVPEQDLSISMSRIPMIPRSGFVIRNVRLAEQRETVRRAQ